MSSRRFRMDRQVSIYRSEVNVREVSHILEGKLDNLPPLSSRTVRVFLSSTFSDMTHERNALMEHEYSKLKKLCRKQYGLEFQVMDLRWGIREQSHNDHTIIDACLSEIENCKNTSIGPNFVAFLGNKYGYRPFPPNIKSSEFQHLRWALTNARQDVSLLDKWFSEDTNTSPPVYRLMPIITYIPNFKSLADRPEEEDAQREWFSTFERLQAMLRHAAEMCHNHGIIDERTREKYFVSVTEYELYRGLFTAENPKKDCVAFYRDITNLDEHLDNRRAAKFTDVKPGTATLDTDARDLMMSLKQKKVLGVLQQPGVDNVSQLKVQWTDLNKDPTDNAQYLEEFRKMFYQRMCKMIKQAQKHTETLDNYVVEVVQHLRSCVSRCEMFRGRGDILQSIKEYLLSEDNAEPLVIYGVSGSGKTSVMAKAGSLVHEWLGGDSCRPVMVLRFLGTTARSSSIRLALGVICWHIAAMYGRDVHEIPTDYPGLVAYFRDVIQVGSAEQPLVLLLDSLDQLTPSHSAHDLTWLPKQLPRHVRIVVSTLQYEHDLLNTLETHMTRRPENFIEIRPLGENLSFKLVQEWLEAEHQCLTDDQYVIVKEVLKRCSLPLYTRLIFKEVCRWKSFSPPEETQLEETVKGVVNTMLARVELYQGETFVRHALAYLTASRHGLSDVEIEDILSLDDSVLNDVFIHWMPPVRRIPPLLWPRLHNYLSSYIIQRESHGAIVYYWYHRQFKTVARERYLSEDKDKLYIHSLLAHYFMGTYGGGVKKAFKYTEKQRELLGRDKLEDMADRKVPLQPLVHGDVVEGHGGGKNRQPFNLRKLSELPHHLIESRRVTDLNKEVLFNYEWLHTKLTAMSIHDLLNDFNLATVSPTTVGSVTGEGRKDVEVQILANTLRIGGSNINENPNTLAFELSARLLPFYDTHRNIRSLIQSCDTDGLRHTSLVPLFQCFESPRGMLMYILEDHEQVVYDLLFSKINTNELVSVSKDGSIGFWDMRTGERTRMIDISEQQPGCNTTLLQSHDGKYLVCDSDSINSPVLIFDSRTGNLLHKVGQRNAAQKRVFMVGYLLCRQKNIIDVRTGEIICNLDDFVESRTYLTCCITLNQRYILVGEADRTSMFDLQTKVKVAELEHDHQPCIFYATEDSTKCYVGYAEDCLCKVWDIDPDSPRFSHCLLTFDYRAYFSSTKFLKGQSYFSGLHEISVSPLDERQVLLNVNKNHLFLLKIKPDYSDFDAHCLDMKAIKATSDTQLFGACFSGNGKFLLAGETHFLHIWAVQGLKLVTTVVLHSIDSFPKAVQPGRGLVVTGSQIHTAIKVWDLDEIYSCGGQQIEVYENPIDMVASSPANRLVFIKKYHSQINQAGFKYIDHFGIDVWNMSTGQSEPFLPFGKYGRLAQFEVSASGEYMAMMLRNRADMHVHVINMRLNKYITLLSHVECRRFTVAPNWDYFTTQSKMTDVSYEVKLWGIRLGELDRFHNISSPVFSLCGKYLLYIDGSVVVVYDLKDRREIRRILMKASELSMIPNKRNQVLVTRWSQGGGHQTDVSVWNFHTGKHEATLQHVAPAGLRDVSRDGRYAIDAYLQVYDVSDGSLVSDLAACSGPNKAHISATERPQFSMVRLTYDAQYAVWADERFVRAARVRDAHALGYVCTHEKAVSLTLLDYGYVVVVGREDGHVLTARLVDGTDHLPAKFRPQKLAERGAGLLDSRVYFADGLAGANLDPLYAARPRAVDHGPPRCSAEIRNMLEQRAAVPHAIIKTPSTGNLVSAAVKADATAKGRRSSSPMAFFNTLRGRAPSPGRESSPVGLKRGPKVSPQASPKTLPRRNAGKVKTPRKSPSMSDLFNGSVSPPANKASPPPPPATEAQRPPRHPATPAGLPPHPATGGGHGEKKTSAGSGGVFTLNTAMQQTCHIAGSISNHVIGTMTGRRPRSGSAGVCAQRRRSSDNGHVVNVDVKPPLAPSETDSGRTRRTGYVAPVPTGITSARRDRSPRRQSAGAGSTSSAEEPVMERQRRHSMTYVTML